MNGMCRWMSLLSRGRRSFASSSTTPTTTTTTIGGGGESEIERRKEKEYLQEIDVDQLPREQRRFAREFQKVNDVRVKNVFKLNYKNQRALIALSLLVISIYLYTIFAIRQETFLEEIDEEMAIENNVQR